LSDELFSSGRQIACRIGFPKSTVHPRLVDSLHFTVRHQTSDIRHQTSDIRHQTSGIFIGFLTSSPAVRKQVESSRVVDPTSRPPVVHPASRIGWGYISDMSTLDQSWFGSPCR
jgi:hypothetical protein